MSDKRRQTSRSTKSSSCISCEDANFVEIEFPQQITPRLIISCAEGLNVLIENQASIPLAAQLITALRSLEKGGSL